MRVPFKFVLAAMAVLLFLQAASAQQAVEPSSLTLEQAVKMALERNPLRKAALADTKAASADVREARSVPMPRLTFSETATRGNDPVYVFGSKLRQQRFASADFALNQLNTPLPLACIAPSLLRIVLDSGHNSMVYPLIHGRGGSHRKGRNTGWRQCGYDPVLPKAPAH